MGRDFLPIPIVIQKEELAKQLVEKELKENPKPAVVKNSEIMVNHDEAFKDVADEKPYNKMTAAEKKQYRQKKKKEEKEAKKKIKDEIKLAALKEKEETKAKKRQESYERKKAKDRERYYERKKASEEEELLNKQLEKARLLAPPQPIKLSIEKANKVSFVPDQFAGFMDRYNRETGKLRAVEEKKVEVVDAELPKHNDYDPWGLARNYRNLNTRPF